MHARLFLCLPILNERLGFRPRPARKQRRLIVCPSTYFLHATSVSHGLGLWEIEQGGHRQSISSSKIYCELPCRLERKKIRINVQESGKRSDRTFSTTYVREHRSLWSPLTICKPDLIDSSTDCLPRILVGWCPRTRRVYPTRIRIQRNPLRRGQG